MAGGTVLTPVCRKRGSEGLDLRLVHRFRGGCDSTNGESTPSSRTRNLRHDGPETRPTGGNSMTMPTAVGRRVPVVVPMRRVLAASMLSVSMSIALLAPGAALAQTAKERELEARV